MGKSRFIGAGILIFLGFGLILIGLFFPVAFIYGTPLLVIGLIIFFNKKEDKIEQIDYSKMKGGKKNEKRVFSYNRK